MHLVQTEITDEVTDMLENETNLVTFSCQATGEPVPTIIWYFDGVMINVSNTSKYNVTSSMHGTVITSIIIIMNTQSSDAGIYTCEAENFLGTIRSSGILTINGQYLSKLFSLIIYICIIGAIDGAEIIEPIGEETVNIMEGDNVTLRCVGVGYPPPLVEWRKLNGSLSDSVSITNMSMLTNEGNVTNVAVDLIFTGTYREDTGVYECSASNLLNGDTRSNNLIIQCMCMVCSYVLCVYMCMYDT